MKLSIVTTLYKSSLYINEFYERISNEATKITLDYEIIFVDDGSPDESLQKAVSLYEKDAKVKVIELSRNFGHHKAIMTGLSHAKGEFVFLIDIDLEEEPELLSKFWGELYKKKDIDVVYGVQESRKGSWFEKFSGEMFYKIFNFFSGTKIPKNFLTVRLMNHRYVSNLVSFQEKEVVFSILTVLTGFKTKELVVKKLDHSPTTYSSFSKIKLLFNVITASSSRPLWLAFNFGLFITVSSLVYILFLVYRKVVHNIGIDGWTSVMVSISFFGGIIILFLGIIGIYLANIFTEVKNRPLTIVKKIHKAED
ncbi:glycosyltransferase family 2 protein [Arcobacter sp.]|uniref:glycosyltransferase family 2 protein n=1 Tax=unclassified Arcobacter TaxID=2593671 RepID=UPI003AFFD21F